MIDGYNRLAKELKKRDNKTKIGACHGVVKSTNPFIVSVFGEYTLEEGDNLSVCETAQGAKVGETVLCVPQEDQQHFFAVARIRR